MTVYPADHRVDLPPLPDQPDGVPWPAAEWPRGEPGPDVDALRLTGLLDQAFAARQPVEHLGLSLATVIVHRGQLIAERYAPSAGPDESLISWSMAKSFTHAAVGLLVGDGRIDIDQPAAVPEWQDDGDPRAAITTRQLLGMVSGLEFNEDYVDDSSHCLEMLWGDEGHRDMAHYAASQDLLHPPGAVFNYSSGTTNILSRIIADHVGRGDDYDAWLGRRLFGPIGITSADPRFDEAGVFAGSSYLYATARDFARFGLLYLRDGVWDGQRLLPEGWVDQARTPRAEDPEDNTPYGAHWWVPAPGQLVARGYEAQRLICVPDRDLIVVRLGKTATDLAPNLNQWTDEIVDCFRP